MSENSYYYGYTIIGCRIDNKDMEKLIKKETNKNKVQRRGCDHEVPESALFCSLCGKARIVNFFKEFTKHDLLEKFEKDGLNYVLTTDNYNCFVTFSKKYIASTGDINYYSSFNMINIPSEIELIELKKTLKNKLEPYGLWNESNFNIWAVGRCSC
jgi:hypothetical protein